MKYFMFTLVNASSAAVHIRLGQHNFAGSTHNEYADLDPDPTLLLKSVKEVNLFFYRSFQRKVKNSCL